MQIKANPPHVKRGRVLKVVDVGGTVVDELLLLVELATMELLELLVVELVELVVDGGRVLVVTLVLGAVVGAPVLLLDELDDVDVELTVGPGPLVLDVVDDVLVLGGRGDVDVVRAVVEVVLDVVVVVTGSSAGAGQLAGAGALRAEKRRGWSRRTALPAKRRQ